MFLILSCSCLCPIHWSQVLSWDWRCSWSNADRQCSNYILGGQQFYCLLRRVLYYIFNGINYPYVPYVLSCHIGLCYNGPDCINSFSLVCLWYPLPNINHLHHTYILSYFKAIISPGYHNSKQNSKQNKNDLALMRCQAIIWTINSLCPSDAIRRQGTESTLAHIMACCLMAPSHYLNQCWLIISKVLWHSSEGIIMRRSEDTNQ